MRSQRELDAIVAELRAAHWALQHPLRHNGLRALLADQAIPVERRDLCVPALTVLQFGRAAICLSNRLNPRESTPVLVEEYAHAKLHAGDVGELTIHLTVMGSDDPREHEAHYVARCLLAGPGIACEYTTPARVPTPRPAFPFTFLDPYAGAPWGVTHARPEPRYGGRFGETALQRALRLARPLPRPMRAAPPSDAGIITYERDGAKTRVRFVDEEGMRWTIHDIAFLPDRTVIEPGRPVAKYRYFVNANGARRLYQFSRWERRDVAPRHCERQLRESTQLPVAARKARSNDSPAA
jgi:hypothetical protein